MPVVIIIAKKIQIATALMIEVGIDQRQHFLMNTNKNMIAIEIKRHTESLKLSVPLSNSQGHC
jgi:hypothetical protein